MGAAFVFKIISWGNHFLSWYTGTLILCNLFIGEWFAFYTKHRMIDELFVYFPYELITFSILINYNGILIPLNDCSLTRVYISVVFEWLCPNSSLKCFYFRNIRRIIIRKSNFNSFTALFFDSYIFYVSFIIQNSRQKTSKILFSEIIFLGSKLRKIIKGMGGNGYEVMSQSQKGIVLGVWCGWNWKLGWER